MNPFGNLSTTIVVAFYIIYLELISWTLHEEEIHDVVYDDIWSKAAWK